jgi:hypothetical protein
VADPAEEMVSAVADAHFTREIEAPSAARERAQRSFTIAGAVATTLVAAGVFTDVASASDAVKVAGLATLGSWILASSLFTWAIASPVKPVGEDQRSDGGAFVTAALGRAKSEQAEIDGRSKWAHRASVVAILGTVATLLLIFFAPIQTSDVRLLLARRGVEDVRLRCPDAVEGNTIKGALEVATLDDDFVVIEPSGACAKAGVRLRLPQDDVLMEIG